MRIARLMSTLFVLSLALLLSAETRLATSNEEVEAEPRLTLVAQTGHAAKVTRATFSPDGRFILTTSQDGTAGLWETETGREVRNFAGHTEVVVSASFSPDGHQVLTASMDGTVRIWDAQTAQELQCIRTPRDSSQYFTFAIFSPDGRRVLTSAGSSMGMRLWMTATGRPVRRYLGHTADVRHAAFSSNGRRIVSASKDGTVGVWGTGSGRRELRLGGHAGGVNMAVFSPNGSRVATASEDGTARLWSAKTGRELRAFKAHDGSVSSASFSPDGKHVLTAGWDRTSRLWEAETGREVLQFRGDSPSFAVFSPDGKYILITYDWVSEVHRWKDAAEKGAQRIEGKALRVTSSAFSRDGRHLLVGSADGAACLWSTRTGREVRRFEAECRSVVIAPGSEHVLILGVDGEVGLWDVETGARLERSAQTPAHAVSGVFSKDGRFVLTTDGYHLTSLWETRSGKVVRKWGEYAEGVGFAALSPDGRYVLTVGRKSGRASVWEMDTGAKVQQTMVPVGRVWPEPFSPDGRHFLTSEHHSAVDLWETESGLKLKSIRRPGERVNFVRFSPDGRHFLTGWQGRDPYLYEIESGQEVRCLAGHRGRFDSAAYSADGRFVLTTCGDGAARLFDATTGKLLCSLVSFRDGAWAVFDPEGRYDDSQGGDVTGLHWVLGMETIALSQLARRYHEPGLLAKHLGQVEEPPHDVSGYGPVKLHPEVEVNLPRGTDRRLNVHIRDRGGGIGRVVVRINGQEVAADAQESIVAPSGKSALVRVDLQGSTHVRAGATNTLGIVAYNAAGTLRSREIIVEWEAPAD